MEAFERIDDLCMNGYRIIQDTRYFRFGIDSALLSDFASVKPGRRVCDLCCGNGAVALLLAAKTRAGEIWGMELQPALCDLARRSVALNHEEGRVFIHCADIRKIPPEFMDKPFDVVTANPPYMEITGSLQNIRPEVSIARHEEACTLFDVIAAAKRLLRFGGHFYMVHKPRRLADILCAMRSFAIEPKRMRMVHAYVDREPEIVLIEGKYGGKPGLKTEPPIILYKPGGQ